MFFAGYYRNKRHGSFADNDRLADGLARCGYLRQNELRLTGPDQLDIDFGKQLGVEQRAMLGAAGIVDRVPHAKIVEPIGPARMLAARNQERIDHALARYQRTGRLAQARH